MRLSIVIPVYNEEDNIVELTGRIDNLYSSMTSIFHFERNEIEVIFVNDGSTDNTFNTLKVYCEVNKNYKLLNLSRNHGHQLAITAGIDNAKGEAVVIIDGDLQDPPEFIVDLYRKCSEGYDVVYAVRKKREGEGWFKLLTAKAFYRMINKLTGVAIPVDTGDFRIMRRRVVDVLSGMRERHRFIRGMISWIGFRQTGLEYIRNERFAGQTKYPFIKMLKFAIDGVTSFSAVPLKIVTWLGFFSAFLGFVYSIYVIYLKTMTSETIQGWSSIIIAVLFTGGAQLIGIGVMGEYLGRISEEAKQRPLYIIEGIYEKRV